MKHKRVWGIVAVGAVAVGAAVANGVLTESRARRWRAESGDAAWGVPRLAFDRSGDRDAVVVGPVKRVDDEDDPARPRDAAADKARAARGTISIRPSRPTTAVAAVPPAVAAPTTPRPAAAPLPPSKPVPGVPASPVAPSSPVAGPPAIAAARAGPPSRSPGLLDRSILLAPRNVELRVLRGSVEGTLDRRADAIASYRSALELDPSRAPLVLTYMGETHLEWRDWRTAAALFRRAVAADPNNARANLGLGQACRALNDADAARAAWQQAARADPEGVAGGMARTHLRELSDAR